MWETTYQERLLDWYQLRQHCQRYNQEQALYAINNWWWSAPIINRAVQWHDYPNWPNPWDLLNNNGYCELAKALGIMYTIMMIDYPLYTSLELVQVENDNLVLVDRGKYILNSAPGEILNIDSTSLSILRSVDSNSLINFLS